MARERSSFGVLCRLPGGTQRKIIAIEYDTRLAIGPVPGDPHQLAPLTLLTPSSPDAPTPGRRAATPAVQGNTGVTTGSQAVPQLISSHSARPITEKSTARTDT